MIKANIKTIVALGAMALGMASCSSDDVTIQTPLSAPTATAVTGETAADKLEFTWSAVDGAYEYKCVLKDSAENVIYSALANNLAAEFNDLTPDQTYTLEVTAYPTPSAGGSIASSATTTLSAKTQPINCTFTQQDFDFDLSLSNFSENVDSVIYCLYHNETNEVTACDSILPDKTYHVTGAVDMVGSYSLYSTGYISSTTISYASKYFLKTFYIPSWEISTGTIMLQGFPLDDDGDVERIKNATLLANADGTYTIKNFYGGNTDFTFKVNSEDNTITPLNAIGNFGTIYTLDHGRYDEDNNPIDVDVLRIDASKSFAYTTDKTTTTSILHRSHGKISLFVYEMTDCDDGYVMPKWGDGCYTFTW